MNKYVIFFLEKQLGNERLTDCNEKVGRLSGKFLFNILASDVRKKPRR